MAVVEPGSGNAPELEDAVYNLRIVKHEDKIREGADDYGNVDSPIVVVHVLVEDVVDEEDNDIILRSTMNRKWSAGGKYPPSTLYLYATGFGVAGAPDEPFDTDWLDDARARGMVTTEEVGKWPKIIAKTLKPAKKEAAQKASTRAQEPAGAAQKPSLSEEAQAVAADRNALSSFWEAAEKYADRGAVADMADSMFGKAVSRLATGEREELLGELSRGVPA